MKKAILTPLFFVLMSAMIQAKLPVIVSILPLQTFTQAIGGDNVEVTVMVQPGSSPHTYEPKPSQMKQVADARLYLAIGVEFEHVWLPKFHDLSPRLPIVDVSHGITRRMMHEAHPEPGEKPTHPDPHVWTTPANVKIIAKNILNALSKVDPNHADSYKQNYQAFLAQIKQTDQKIRTLLSGLPKGTKFMVFHPSWGYFADTYGLTQLPVQVAGKSPKPRELIALVKEARTQHVRAIFTQPEFSDTTAKVLAKELHIPVRKISPMAPDWSANLIRLARDIAGQKTEY
jgi:zinc transport system substrate-binding protein